MKLEVFITPKNSASHLPYVDRLRDATDFSISRRFQNGKHCPKTPLATGLGLLSTNDDGALAPGPYLTLASITVMNLLCRFVICTFYTLSDM